MNENNIRFIGWVTLIGFSVAAYLVLSLFGDASTVVFNNQYSVIIQLLFGSFLGILFGFIALLATQWRIIKPATEKYITLIKDLNLDLGDIIFLSICAGFGEEVFFRGVLQEFWGVWITAVVFVAIHGYLNPKNWRISVYGVLMTMMIGAIGYLKIYVGLWACMVAHAWIDFVLFYWISKNLNSPNFLKD